MDARQENLPRLPIDSRVHEQSAHRVAGRRALLLGHEANRFAAQLGRALKKTALQNGVILRVDPSWFAVVPALIIDKPEVDELFDLVEQSLKDALDQV